ncbi:hypothetical protein DK842_21365 [Chromobacterium phragmitis]|nr:hypothetical protein DK842_21365 [Chromobacterium phragmitis]
MLAVEGGELADLRVLAGDGLLRGLQLAVKGVALGVAGVEPLAQPGVVEALQPYGGAGGDGAQGEGQQRQPAQVVAEPAHAASLSALR